jgi:glycosyltransferase involved in cell wall biosynthesis
MTKLYYVDIQPLDQRYSEQWSRWIPEQFSKEGFEVKTISGVPLVSKIEKGDFLDVNGSHYYTFVQLQKISEMFYEGKIQDGDVFFFGDLEFPGHMEAVRNLATLNKVNVELYGFMHASSVATVKDMANQLQEWQKYGELSWISAMDGVFVGSEFFKEELVSKLINKYASPKDQGIFEGKIHAVGNPWDTEDVRNSVNPLPEKENIIIFPHRWSQEKNPNIFINLAYALKKEFPEWEFAVTLSAGVPKDNWLNTLCKVAEKDEVIKVYRGLSKKEYYTLMAKSKFLVSCSDYESFGYTVTEAQTFGTFCLVPDNFSYLETTHSINRYTSYDELLKILVRLISRGNDYYKYVVEEPYLKRADESVKRMSKIIKHIPDFGKILCD